MEYYTSKLKKNFALGDKVRVIQPNIGMHFYENKRGIIVELCGEVARIYFIDEVSDENPAFVYYKDLEVISDDEWC